MLDRIAEAFTKPHLYQTPIDQMIVACACLVPLAMVFAVALLVYKWSRK